MMCMNPFMFMHEKCGYFIILLMNTLVLDMCIGNTIPYINSLKLKWNWITYWVNILVTLIKLRWYV